MRVEYADGEYQVSDDVIKDFGAVDAEVLLNDNVPADDYERMLYSAEPLRKVYFEEKGDAEIREGSEVKDEQEEVKDEPMGEAGPHITHEPEVKDEVAV